MAFGMRLNKQSQQANSEHGISSAYRPQLSAQALGLTQMADPHFRSLLTDPIPTFSLNSMGLNPYQANIFTEAVRQAVNPLSAGAAARGFVSPENIGNIGGQAAMNIAPTFLPLVNENILLPEQIRNARLTPFLGYLQQLSALLGGQSQASGSGWGFEVRGAAGGGSGNGTG